MSDYFLKKEGNMPHALLDGPRFVSNHFLDGSLIHHMDILYKVGNAIGTLLKVDTCTFTILRRRYTCIRIEVPLKKQLKNHVFVGSHYQPLHYEGFRYVVWYHRTCMS